jgi:hypothetical protein
MAPFEMTHVKRHALAEKSPDHYGHFRPTSQRYPAFSAGIVPFRWLMLENMDSYKDLYDLDLDKSREPDLGYHTDWIHEAENQKSLLEGFAAHLHEAESLCFFYAKHVPFVEGTSRVLIGVGRVKNIGSLTEYAREGEGMRGMVWERPVQHSLRPKGRDGFLMPYYELLQKAEQDPSIDLEKFTAKAPEEHWDEFSYASELVTHDGAIGAMLALETALARMEDELGIATGWQRKWIHDELVKLWKVRGPFPGLGAVLSAFGLSRGLFLAHALQQKAGENADPWPLVQNAFDKNGATLPKELQRDIMELGPTWRDLPSERKSFLSLLSRFELNKDQAAAFYEEGARRKKDWDATDKEILQNPYRIYEISRHHPLGIHLHTVDRGIFPEDAVRLRHPLPTPSQLGSGVDIRRVRAFAVEALENAAENGHTLMPIDKAVEAIAARPIRPACSVTGDILSSGVKNMSPEVLPVSMEDGVGVQLERYRKIGDLIRMQVNGRVQKGKRHVVQRDWEGLINKKFGATENSEEKRARREKAAALKELAEARFCVLAGPAGAGKTTVLGILCSQSEIQNEGVLLLAPTGKARVRMQELAGQNSKALTIAQFLYQHGRYISTTGRYVMSDRPKAPAFGTVIVDECSMLTEDMLGAVFDALQGVNRFILVGDPAQLPPIGAGRPFVDIIAKLRPENYERQFPRVSAGYAELTIERRQVGTERADLRLARWFSASPPSAGEDDIFNSNDNHPTICFVQWDKPQDFQSKLLEVLTTELKLNGSEDVRGFNQALGAVQSGDYDYFNHTKGEKGGSVDFLEKWQILSPLRGMPFGVGDINRLIHEKYRVSFLNLATQRWRSIPKPFGAERIVYGDKVINLRNHRRDGKKVYPEGALGYLANGEIGIAVGLWLSRKNPKILKVEFSSQKGFMYDFYGSDFRDEGEAALELAYALTIHKSQGSQFNLVIVVLPEGHPILSRELIYTALTRHQERVVVMHQGPRSILKDFAAPHRSDIARRMTNLLTPCCMIEFPLSKGSVFLQKGLIHRTGNGIAVRSKSELLIYKALCDAGYRPEYEKALTLGGVTRYPDFTIEDEITGRTVYWEHLGMMDREDYKASWEKKLKWYKANGVSTVAENKDAERVLITTSESSETGFDLGKIEKTIRDSLK